MLRIPATLCLLGLGLLARSPGSSRVAPNVAIACDSLKTRVTDPLRYRQRGDRCEGVYSQDVSTSSSLLVASLVESFEAIDDRSSLPLRVAWTPPDGEAVALRAFSIKPGLFYRMETAKPIAALLPVAGRRPSGPSHHQRRHRSDRLDLGGAGR